MLPFQFNNIRDTINKIDTSQMESDLESIYHFLSNTSYYLSSASSNPDEAIQIITRKTNEAKATTKRLQNEIQALK